MASKYIKKFKVPNNFENILSDFAKEILRNQPKDILDFGIEYFKGLETNSKYDYKDKGENRPENYKRPENQEPNIIHAPNNLEISQEDKNRLQRSMDKIDKINKDPIPVKEKEEDKEKIEEKDENKKIEDKKDEEINTQNEIVQERHISKYMQEEETTTVKKVATQQLHVTKQVTVIKNGEVIKNERIEQKYNKILGNDENGQNILQDGELAEDNIQEKPLEKEEQEVNERYGRIIEENEEHKKEYDDWFTKHSIDKQVIDYKPQQEKLDENLKRNEVGYKTWFNNHSVRSIVQSKNDEEKLAEGNKMEYNDWFNRHSGDKLIIDFNREEKKIVENVTRCKDDYPTWFENHSKLTNKYN